MRLYLYTSEVFFLTINKIITKLTHEIIAQYDNEFESKMHVKKMVSQPKQKMQWLTSTASGNSKIIIKGQTTCLFTRQPVLPAVPQRQKDAQIWLEK